MWTYLYVRCPWVTRKPGRSVLVGGDFGVRLVPGISEFDLPDILQVWGFPFKHHT